MELVISRYHINSLLHSVKQNTIHLRFFALVLIQWLADTRSSNTKANEKDKTSKKNDVEVVIPFFRS